MARWAGVSQQNDLPAQSIDTCLCVVPPCFTALQLLLVVCRPPCVRAAGPTYTLLYGEGVREQGRCFHGLALLSGEGLTKHTGYIERDWMLGTESAPSLGDRPP